MNTETGFENNDVFSELQNVITEAKKVGGRFPNYQQNMVELNSDFFQECVNRDAEQRQRIAELESENAKMKDAIEGVLYLTGKDIDEHMRIEVTKIAAYRLRLKNALPTNPVTSDKGDENTLVEWQSLGQSIGAKLPSNHPAWDKSENGKLVKLVSNYIRYLENLFHFV